MRTLRPSTKLGSTTLWLGVLCILFIVLGWLTGSAAGSKLSSWTTFVTVVAFCALWLTFHWARRILHPSTKLGRTTLWLGGFSVLFIVLRWVTGSTAGSKLGGWATFITIVLAFCTLWLTFRWATRHLMWRLRHMQPAKNGAGTCQQSSEDDPQYERRMYDEDADCQF